MQLHSPDALTDLLVEMFSDADELRRALAVSPLGRNFVAKLPGGTASLAQVVFSTIERAQQMGCVDVIRSVLIHHAPLRSDEIEDAYDLAHGEEKRRTDTRGNPRSNLVGPNPDFVGRRQELAALQALLTPEGGVAALTGMPGVGKSSLTLKYAWEHRGEFDTMCWVDASATNIAASIAALATCPLQLRLPARTPVLSRARAVRMFLESGAAHLLVLDNADDPKAVRNWIPSQGKTRVLITTRQASIPGVESVRVKELPPDDALKLLLGKHGHDGAELSAAESLCQELGNLPLAVAVAGSLLHDQGFTPQVLLAHIRAMGPLEYFELLRADSAPFSESPSLMRLFASSVKSFDASRCEDVIAFALLKIGGWFAPVEIPRGVLHHAVERLLGESIEDVHVDHAMMRLIRLSLAQGSPSGGLSFHRLVQAFARHLGGAITRNTVLDEMSALALNAPRGKAEAIAREPLLAHFEAMLEHIEPGAAGPHLGIADALTDYYHEAAHFSACLRVSTQFRGKVKLCWEWVFLYKSGQALTGLGRLGEALDCFERAHEIHNTIGGALHATHATLVLSVGRTLQELQRYDEAVAFYRRAYDICVNIGAMDAPIVGAILLGLGQVSRFLGKYDDAMDYLKRALDRVEKENGSDHPRTAVTLLSVGQALYEQMRYTEATADLERSLSICERNVPDHPNAATALYYMGMICYALGDNHGARTQLERCMTIREKTLGLDHRDTRRISEFLADLEDLRDKLRISQAYRWPQIIESYRRNTRGRWRGIWIPP